MQRFAYRVRARLARQVLAGILAVGMVAVPYARESQAGSVKTDPREKRARQAFAAGRYAEALDLFVTLYGDTVHPTYLRNIGRCYQNLKQPDSAINAFRDYLRLAKGLTVSEKGEIEGYIAEMESMKKASASSPATPTATAGPSQPTIPLPTPSSAKTEPTPSAGTTVTQVAQPTPPPEESPFYKKGWFWGVVGGVVVVGVVGALVAAGTFSQSDPCSGRVCVNLGDAR